MVAVVITAATAAFAAAAAVAAVWAPLVVNLEGKKVLIVGGGGVGERKARFFEGAAVTVVAREFTEGLRRLAADGRVELVPLDVADDASLTRLEALVREAFLVVAATDDAEINERVEKLARRHGKLVNRADRPGDVLLPATLRRDGILIAISTQGRSPATARHLRQLLESVVGEEHARMVELQREMRAWLKGVVKRQRRRERILREILRDEEVWAALRESYERGKALAFEKCRRLAAQDENANATDDGSTDDA
ncbi:MAG: precorrin-2 dehydrogenase/sirohydrochlorin ferrochelatase family protein [Candidatus Alkanophagales archaeon]